MNDDRSTAARIATGAAVGLVAGLVASFAMDRFQAAVQPSSGDDGDDDREPATQRAADAVAERVTGDPLPDDAKPAGGQAVHYGLGAGLGVAYGIAAAFVPAVTAGAGTAFAGATWALIDEGAVPLAGLGEAPWKSPAKTHAYGLVSHLVFGVAAELTRRLGDAALDRALAGGGQSPRRRHRSARKG